MTIRRQWLLVLIFTAIIAVAVNSYVLSTLINRYFINYTTENYDMHFTQVVDFSKNALLDKNYSKDQIAIQLEAYLDDPIIRIKLYDANGQLLADVGNEINMMNGMMKNRMMNSMMGAPTEEVDSAEISDSGISLGKLNITRYSLFGNSLATRKFKAALIANTFFSIGIVLIFVVIIGVIISRKMSRDLIHTAAMALNIDLGEQMDTKLSKVKEVRIIQQSLETLKARLKLKQTGRKKLIDELVHQTRTPLTILKTHLEAFEDGVIQMTTAEIKTCEVQIENLTSIITNMSKMLDAQKEADSVKLEELEFNQLLKQIIGGLKIQFDKKQIDLSLVNHQRLTIKTDKYKLSQIIYNILTNAYKFTDPKGKVSIGYKSDGHELSLTIEDTGTGIGDEDKNHLFDAYYRGNNAKNITGEGIGLYVVKENLNAIKGSISVTSELGSGSRFVIKIPRNIGI